MKTYYLLIFALIIVFAGCRRNRNPDPYPQQPSLSDTFVSNPAFFQVDMGEPGENGHSQNAYPSGQIKSEGSYNNGVPSGYWKFYYENGRLKKEGNINNGQPSGYWKYYFENGLLLAEGNFNNGIQSGHWKYYYPNGPKESEGSYNNGYKVGEWIYYEIDGRILYNHYY